MDRRLFIGAGALAVVSGGAYLAMRPSQEGDVGLVPGAANAQEVAADTVTEVGVTVPDMVLGDPYAPVTLIEYASYTCPHCASFHANQYVQLKRDYIETGKVKMIFREVYFDRPGLWASLVARCGGPLRYFGISEILFAEQQNWARQESGPAIAAELQKIGLTAGLTQEQLDACFADADQAQALVTWYEENATKDDVRSTPTLFVDGVKYGNMNYSELSEIIDARLAAQ